MGVLEFLALVIGSLLSWPVLAAATVLLFRRQLGDLLGRIKSYEGMGQKVTFGDSLAAAETLADQALADSDEGPLQAALPGGLADAGETAKSSAVSTAQRLAGAGRDPSFVLLTAWEELETAVSRVAQRVADPDGAAELRSLQGRLAELERNGLIGPKFVARQSPTRSRPPA